MLICLTYEQRAGPDRWPRRAAGWAARFMTGVFFAIVVVTIVALIYMRIRGQEEWMDKAQLVFEQRGSRSLGGPAPGVSW